MEEQPIKTCSRDARTTRSLGVRLGLANISSRVRALDRDAVSFSGIDSPIRDYDPRYAAAFFDASGALSHTVAASTIAANIAVSPMLQAKTLSGFEFTGDAGPSESALVDFVHEAESREAQGRH